jgi:hypothetical protein
MDEVRGRFVTLPPIGPQQLVQAAVAAGLFAFDLHTWVRTGRVTALRGRV